jgi:putative spermidine/putrescine transport system substrate-binding protein
MSTSTRPTRRTRRARQTAVGAAVAALALLVAGCGTSGSDTSAGGGGGFTAPKLSMLEKIGPGEGELNVLAWPGYAEDGTNDKSVDWVSPFEKKTGCQVHVKDFGTSDDAVSLMHAGGYDVVSASGDATLRLISAGDVEPVNTSLVPNYADISPFLKEQGFNSVKGQMYGIPHGWGANLLMYNTSVVKPPPTSWSAVFDGASKYAGKVTAYDSPIYIADAALYLMNTKPSLGIKNPYAIDKDQLAAAVDVLKNQKKSIAEYWPDYTTEVNDFKTGTAVIGTAWQINANLAAEKAPVATVFPKDGSTGWSDTWMVGAKSQHKNCAYMWLNWITSRNVQAQVAQWFGEAPANPKACAITGKKFCAGYHVTDAAYAKKIWYWTTPISQCLDGRTDTTCTTYKDWTDAWTEIKG